jgi:hypothetical protein
MDNGTRDRSFDALTRGIASGDLSRRKALSLLGTVVVGGSLSSVSEVAEAARGGVCASGGFCTPPLTCCGTRKGGATCCGGAVPVCCIRKNSPDCTSTVESCKTSHGHVV